MVDRISKLPDEVLCHILSFLPTEEAVTTMVLSKRWKPLWPSVSTLDLVDDRYLDDKESKPYSSFIKFVYAAILSRGLNQPIKNFTLIFHDYSFEGKVRSLSKLVRADVFFDENFFIPVKAFRNVEFLRIIECDGDIPVFPNLTCMELFLGGSIKFSVALDMLNHCPKLQVVVFDFTNDDDEDGDVWPYPQYIPECFSSHLTKCFLKDFKGLDRHMRFARYVMKNSTSLRTMSMTIDSYCKNQKKEVQMIKELASYSRSSPVFYLSN